MSKYKNTKYQYLQPIFFAIILVAGIYLGKSLFQNETNPYESSSEVVNQSNKIGDIVRYIEDNYVDPVDLGSLSQEAITGMLESLDPHSSYIPIEDFNEVNDPLQGKFEGIGVQFRIQNDTIMVFELFFTGGSNGIHNSQKYTR